MEEEEVSDSRNTIEVRQQRWQDMQTQFSALFTSHNPDPIQNFEIPPPDLVPQIPPMAATTVPRCLQLFIKGPELGEGVSVSANHFSVNQSINQSVNHNCYVLQGSSPVLVPLTDPQATVFHYVQLLNTMTAATRLDKFSEHIWDTTYTYVILYTEEL